MVYLIKKAIEYKGKTYLPGSLIKLTKEEAAKYKESIKAAKYVTKQSA